MKTNQTQPVPPHPHNLFRTGLLTGKLLTLALGACAFLPLANFQAEAATPYALTNGSYLENFFDVANWTANFAAGIGATTWSSVAVNSTGTIPDGKKTTVSTATFSTGTSGGVQKGTNNIVLLS